MKKLEILQELPKCDPETRGEQCCWRNGTNRVTCFVATKLQFVKNTIKQRTIKWGMPVLFFILFFPLLHPMWVFLPHFMFQSQPSHFLSTRKKSHFPLSSAPPDPNENMPQEHVILRKESIGALQTKHKNILQKF